MNYLCYDVKGIQAFIFAIPRLKYIVGGSVLIDQFDRDTIPKLSSDGARCLFAGGGKGVFACDDATAETTKHQIIEEAHAIGLSIAIGQSKDYSEAAQCADRFFPFMPESNELDGHPCQASGLYPVRIRPGSENVHSVVRKRVFQRGDLLRRRLEDRLLTDLRIPQIKACSDARNVEFFHDIGDDKDEGGCALDALGGRGRWAIICMDGNDIGSQFRAFQASRPSETEMCEYVKAMSLALDACSQHAAARGCEEVLRHWAREADRVADGTTADGTVILPLRPVVVGGDDIVVLCHAQYAFDFVTEACRAFAEQSVRKAGAFRNLWPATGDTLTTSAGVLFCPLSLPLHMAIPYAESLLASAKGEGRKHTRPGEPSPACIDFEVVTESMLDTPADRRNRELRFIDGDTDTVIELTERPYRLDRFSELRREAEQLERIPRSIRHQLLPALRAGTSDRAEKLERLCRNLPRPTPNQRVNYLWADAQPERGSDIYAEVASLSRKRDNGHRWKVKLSGRPVNRKSKREGLFLPGRDNGLVELPPRFWTEYQGRNRHGDHPELKRGDLVWLEPDSPDRAEITSAAHIKSLQWARWGRAGENLLTLLQEFHPEVIPDAFRDDGLVDEITDLFGHIPHADHPRAAPAFAARIRPDNLVFYDAKNKVQPVALVPLSTPHPGCVAFYRDCDDLGAFGPARPLRGYKVYRNTTEREDSAPWHYTTQGIYHNGRLRDGGDPRQKLNQTCELLPEGQTGCLRIALRDLTKRELSLLLAACSVDWRLGGGKPLGLGHCRVTSATLIAEFGSRSDLFLRSSETDEYPPPADIGEYAQLVTDLAERIALYHESQRPVEKIRYPRASVENRNTVTIGGHVWFNRHASKRKGGDARGLEVLHVSEGSVTVHGFRD